MDRTDQSGPCGLRTQAKAGRSPKTDRLVLVASLALAVIVGAMYSRG